MMVAAEMSKFTKPGNAMLALASHYEGHKVVTVKNIGDGSSDTPHRHALLAGTNRSPCKVTAASAKKKIAKRYAVLCGYVSEFEGLQNKINYGYRFKKQAQP
ncbi:hypothetical protein Celaphus_00005693 [Cervus elaphus hippelaphus]|uniref:Uncharacterized protein n=1 Tax=Cervus elaphus hippelaphus TaxID=46360 RepID=A0A212CVL1_CEREH|nr:hypothetical protein Celaphus_00005693 [Cervus elaphus hippelaphus]